MKYHFKIQDDPDGFWPNANNCRLLHPSRNTRGTPTRNARSNRSCYRRTRRFERARTLFQTNQSSATKNIVKVALDPKIVLAFLVRYHQNQPKGFTQQEIANKILGFDFFIAISDLRTGDNNPTLATIVKIKEHYSGYFC